jgi:3-methyladenine DNA glycosylase Tag
VLFERLILEINQAGLSWATILKKRAAFRAACADFSVDRVAAFGTVEIERLLADPGIIRNRLKIEAAAENARRIQALRQSHGSFALWLAAHHPRAPEEWTQLFRRTFRFTGGGIVGEFLMSIGYCPAPTSQTARSLLVFSNTHHHGRTAEHLDRGYGLVRRLAQNVVSFGCPRDLGSRTKREGPDAASVEICRHPVRPSSRRCLCVSVLG